MRRFTWGVLAALFGAQQAAGETMMERVERDGVAMVEDDDHEMAAAIGKARATLDEFLSLVRKAPATITGYALKVEITDGVETEFFWVSPFRQERNGTFRGGITNTPQLVKNVKFGQVIAFKRSAIVDWLYIEGGAMRGNYTACVLVKREPPEQREAFIKKFGLTCDP